MKHEEWLRYRRQAAHTLESARRDRQAGDHDWACFKAQQCAEIVLKGYLRATLEYVTGHSVVKLLALLGPAVPDDLAGCARDLDKAYIPARYPDAFEGGAPLDYFDDDDSAQAIGCAEKILGFVDDLAAQKPA